MARLARFVPPGPAELNPAHSELDNTTSAANPWPELDIVADTFVSRGHDLGKLELDATPDGADWRIQKLSLVSNVGRIDANGWWRVRSDRQETQIDTSLTTDDAGAYRTVRLSGRRAQCTDQDYRQLDLDRRAERL